MTRDFPTVLAVGKGSVEKFPPWAIIRQQQPLGIVRHLVTVGAVGKHFGDPTI